MPKTKGLAIQLPGSAGKASRPATVKLLALPPRECRATLAQKRGCDQRLLSERKELATAWRNGRLDHDVTLLPELRRR